MKKILSLLILISLFSFKKSHACEICGCANNNFQIGLLPNFSKGFFGLRYSHLRYNSQIKGDASEFSHDYYQGIEFWGGLNLKKIQVMTFLPYIISRKESDDGISHSQGIGDLMVLINYKILGSTSLTKSENKTVRHELFFGAGIKLPTGVNSVNPADPDFNIGDFNSQAGTGSVDYLFNTTYNFMWNKSGLVTNLAYRINSANNQNYKFGNRIYLSSSYYYTITKSKIKIKPNIGVNYQSNAVNTYNGTQIESSNGYNLSIPLGVNVLQNKFGINAMTFVPVYQNYFDGQTKLKSRILLGLTYSF